MNFRKKHSQDSFQQNQVFESMRANLAFVTALKMVTRAYYYTIEGFMLESLYYAIKLR